MAKPTITERMARELPRFDFIARWLVVATRKKANRGPLGLYVRRQGGAYEIVSPIGGGTVTYRTPDPARLFDHARRGQLGAEIRRAEDFRTEAYLRAEQVVEATQARSPAQLQREVDEFLRDAG